MRRPLATAQPGSYNMRHAQPFCATAQ
ncbi:hypothetical protein L195_g064167, partial [Trifolium pratense]